VLTASFWNTNVRDNTNELYGSIRRLAYQTRTSNYTTVVDNFAAAADYFTTVTFTADGTSAYRFYAFVPTINTQAAGRYGYLSLDINDVETGYVVAGNANAYYTSLIYDRYLVPSAGVKTVTFRAYHFSGAVEFVAGTGTGGAYIPAWMAVYGPALT
jgi:hypothetical protein